MRRSFLGQISRDEAELFELANVRLTMVDMTVAFLQPCGGIFVVNIP
jgi:hypothetical protein